MRTWPSHRLSEGALSAGLHVRAADLGNGQHRQGREVHQRVPRNGHPGAGAGCELLGIHFTPAANAIRFGLGAIKNVGANAVESIMKARTEGGTFNSLYDFCERVDFSAVNRRMIESFIKAGALDSLGGTRAQLFAVIDGAMETGARAQKDRDSGQSGLFADLAAHEPAADHPLPNVPDWTPRRNSPARRRCSVSTSPAILWISTWTKSRELATHFTAGLEGLAEEHRSRALRHPHRHPAQAKQGRQALGRPADRGYGRRLEAMVFSTQYERLLPVLDEDKAVLVRGLVLPEENAPPKISVQDIVPLENARVRLPSLISIRVPVNGAGERPDRCRPRQRSFPIVRPQARRDRSSPAPRKAARLLGYPGRNG